MIMAEPPAQGTQCVEPVASILVWLFCDSIQYIREAVVLGIFCM